jgi:hypothetical protein
MVSSSRQPNPVTPTIPVVSIAPLDPQIGVAVLKERLDHVIAALEAMDRKIDALTKQQDRELSDLDKRVRHLEDRINGARWFLFGVAAGGGALGGGVAAMVANMLGAG